jgi:protease-4
MGERGLSLFDSDALIAAGDLVRTLRKVRADKTVKAVVLRLDSPGGSALASDVVWQEVRRLGEQVPVVASLGNVAASGGYYIASAAKRIVAEPTTITGSIGVFGGKLVLGGLLDKIGVHTVVLKRGKHAGLFSSLTRFSDSERALLRRHMQHTYDTFVNRVAKGRRMSYDAVHRVGQGRVWSGKQARDVGLVDALGGLDEAVAAAAKLAGLDPKAIERVTYPEARSLLEMLQDDKVQLKLLGGAPLLKLLSQVAPAAPALAKRLLAAVTTLQAILAREPTAAMLPFVLTVR